nr:putative YD repeat-containing protein [Candidatus Pantoea persica]
MKRALTAALVLGSLCAFPALWAAACGPHSQAVASSNSWIMLGAKGAVR